MADEDGAGSRGRRAREALGRAGRRVRELDHSVGLRTAVQRVRRALPGDAHFGDPLSLGGARHAESAGRAVVGLTGDRPGVTREVGLGGLQLGQAVLERGDLLGRLDSSTLSVRRKRWHTRLKGTPDDLKIFAIDRH
ncbi:hypothetical protein PHK61_05850 [Actinomycetospora lutea]|uniref:hypothetical protein n=1 Tax=Actinomycetospora lutea TaxID=663604 RepID=UPI0023670D61|nr:hypothetical protein [Actinomycetospora lutea]MDD7937940.1 hypothetical protein [Actinomycetospora lutea]